MEKYFIKYFINNNNNNNNNNNIENKKPILGDIYQSKTYKIIDINRNR